MSHAPREFDMISDEALASMRPSDRLRIMADRLDAQDYDSTQNRFGPSYVESGYAGPTSSQPHVAGGHHPQYPRGQRVSAPGLGRRRAGQGQGAPESSSGRHLRGGNRLQPGQLKDGHNETKYGKQTFRKISQLRALMKTRLLEVSLVSISMKHSCCVGVLKNNLHLVKYLRTSNFTSKGVRTKLTTSSAVRSKKKCFQMEN